MAAMTSAVCSECGDFAQSLHGKKDLMVEQPKRQDPRFDPRHPPPWQPLDRLAVHHLWEMAKQIDELKGEWTGTTGISLKVFPSIYDAVTGVLQLPEEDEQ
jgi:hypothetical protein